MTLQAELALESPRREPGAAAELDLSVLVTVVERPASLPELYREYAAPLRALGRSFEFVFAAHPQFREALGALRELAAAGEPVRVIEVGQAVGETTLLRLAADAARGRALITLPAYHQVEASALPALLARLEAGADLAVARRWPRRDSIVNRLQSALLHWSLGSLAGGRLRDVACGVRAIRPALLDELPLYGDFVRFLPLLALRDGHRVEEVPAPIHPAAMKGRIYGAGVYLRRIIDVLGLLFLLRFTDKPLRFFGLVGAGVGLAGAAILALVFVQRLAGQGAADRPLLLLGVLLLTLGVQAIALGLVGEMIVHLSATRRRSYRVRPPDPAPSDRAAP